MRILVVEDVSSHKVLLKKKGLTEQGYQVDVASDGQRRRSVPSIRRGLSATTPDRMLPKLDGMTVLNTLRSAKKPYQFYT